MKQFGRFRGLLAAYGVAVLATSLTLTVQAQTQQGQAQVQAITGSADYSEGGGTWTQLRVGKMLKAGTVVRTAAGSQVDLYLRKNGPVVRLVENTTLALDKLLFEDTGADTVIETQLDLKAGRILGAVDKMAAASKYEVKTPNSVTGIRGTKYDISANGKVVVVDGWVMVIYVDAKGKTTSYRVDEGQTFDPTIPGVRPSTPEEKEYAETHMPKEERPTTVIIKEIYREPFTSPTSPLDGPSSSPAPGVDPNRGG